MPGTPIDSRTDEPRGGKPLLKCTVVGAVERVAKAVSATDRPSAVRGAIGIEWLILVLAGIVAVMHRFRASAGRSQPYPSGGGC
ncbi:MAG: hypothetical protein U5K76_12265 [Woeseiaceae bacterium]|nr:hypothetical protein [Woeseiaceae bacterium]